MRHSDGSEEEINGTFPFAIGDESCVEACEKLGNSHNKHEDYCSGTPLMSAIHRCSTAEVQLPDDWCGHGDTTTLIPQEDLNRLVQDRGGQFGDNLRLTMTWDKCDDLDLHLVEPGTNRTQIWWRAPRAPSGGTLDIDQRDCDGTSGQLPLIENINYGDVSTIPHGTYTAELVYYDHVASLGETHWTLQIASGGVINNFEGVMNATHQRKRFSFTYPPSTSAELATVPEVSAEPERKAGAHSWTTEIEAKYQAISSLQETMPAPVGFLQQPEEMAAMENWDHAQCEPAFNARCWNKSRFSGCCRDCSEVAVKDRCAWTYTSSMGTFQGNFGVTSLECFDACTAIRKTTWSWSDFCDDGLVFGALEGCPAATASVRNNRNVTFCGHGPYRHSPDQ